MGEASYKKFLLRKVEIPNGEYSIFDVVSGEHVWQSKQIAMTENSEMTFTIVTDDVLDSIIAKGGTIEVRGHYEHDTFKIDFIEQRLIIKWSRL